MRDVDLDLDAPEPSLAALSPQGRPRRWIAALGAAALLFVLAAYVTAHRPPPHAVLADPPPAWRARVLAETGRPFATQVTAHVVLVTGEWGLAAYDRATGRERWRLDGRAQPSVYGEVPPSVPYVLGGATIAGDAVVWRRTPPPRTGERPYSAYDVLDLATGVRRFTVEHDPEQRNGFFDADISATAITAANCFGRPDGGCEVTSYALGDGSVRWRWTTDEAGVVEFPAPIVAMPRGGSAGGPVREGPYRVPQGRGIALHRSMGVYPETVTTIDLATGETLGRWTQEEYVPPVLLAVDGRLLAVSGGVVRTLDPATGGPLWSAECFGEYTWQGDGSAQLVIGGRWLDRAQIQGYQFIDLDTGARANAVRDATSWPLLIRPDVTVAYDGRSGAATAVDAETGRVRWTAVLPRQPGDIYAGDEWMVFTGTAEPRAWYVNLATGYLGGVGAEPVNGVGDGAVVTASTGEGGGVIALYELGVR